MKFKKLNTLIIAFVVFVAGTMNTSANVKSDFVFVIDATGSMGGEINAVKNGFSGFVNGLDTNNIDARFSVVLFGGPAELVLDFTSDTTAVLNAFNSISVSGGVSGFQNNHNINPEAGLEAIRLTLGAGEGGTKLVTNNLNGSDPGADGYLDYRSNARKNLIFVTDEDSDRPYYVANRESGQTGNEPPIPTDGNTWQTEIDNTAQVVIDNDAFVNMLINRNDTPAIYQYGDWVADVSDADFLNYDADATLTNLQASSATDDSLQAQVLASGLIARTFNINSVNDQDFIDNFYAAKIEETIENPVETPEPSALILLGSGLLFLAGRRRRLK
ncbi:MAG: VWA domain-containing protein [Gammaproteobacteria bacterium]|nr:VWA domain-containing protein [Gammaproteobacteria bacterium]